MILTKLRGVAITLALGMIAAGAVAMGQPAAGRRKEPVPDAEALRPSSAVSVPAGNLIIDWIPADGKPGKKEIKVDASRHCVHLAMMSVKRDSRPNDGAIRLDLERGKTYTVAAAGEAFMSEHTGRDADPFPGVMLLYGTDDEDGYAIRQVVLAPGKSITFRSPWLIDPKDDVFLMAFFLNNWPDSPNRGGYTLTITEAGDRPRAAIPLPSLPATLPTSYREGMASGRY